MMTLTPPSTKLQTPYEQALQHHRPALSPQAPAWWNTVQQAAWEQFEAAGFPTRRMEAWRYADLRPMLALNFQPFPAETRAFPHEAVASYLYAEAAHSRLVFYNGHFSPEASSFVSLPDGVVVTTLQQALGTHADLIQRHLTQHTSVDTDAFTLLNTAMAAAGVFVYVPRDVAVETPLHVLFVTQSDSETPQVAYPRSLVIVEAEAKLTMITSFVGFGEHPYLNNAVMDLHVGPHADLNYTHLQSESRHAYAMARTRVTLTEHSRASLASFAFGGRLTRHAVDVRFEGEHAHCMLNGLAVLKGQSQVLDHTMMAHTTAKGTSNQLYKGILGDRARSEFYGMIQIARDAAQTNAAQMNRNLLLSDDARVVTRPQLRIDNEDVKCTHGATIGHLEEDQLFYLQSRGIPLQTARHVLTLGFAGEIIAQIPVPSAQAHLAALVAESLHEVNAEKSHEAEG